MAAKKGASSKKPATLKQQDLLAATLASVKAAVGKSFPRKPGILTGFWLEDGDIERLGVKPEDLAEEVAKAVSLATRVKVTKGIVRGGGGVLVGFIQPSIGPEK